MAATVDIIYSLKEDEIYRSLKKSGFYKTSGMKMIIENILLAGFGVYFLFAFIQDTSSILNLVLAIVCIVFMGVIIVVPTMDMKRQAKKQADGKEIKMRISPQKITIGDGEKQWSIPLDGTSKSKIVDNELIAIITPKKQLVVLPVRAIPRDRTYELQSRIFDGTSEAK